jgi:hypothetical protein
MESFRAVVAALYRFHNAVAEPNLVPCRESWQRDRSRDEGHAASLLAEVPCYKLQACGLHSQ